MKFVFIITLASLFTLNVSAQTVAITTPKSEAKTMSATEKKALEKRHTLTAIQQINVHLNQNLSYTPTMEEYQAEGTIELIVSLKPNGAIVSFDLTKNQSPLLQSAVKEAMGKINTIRFRGTRYEGARKIRIPIKFLKS